MRARNIKPGFFKNEDLAAISYQARLLFAGLWCMADREGRLEKRPLRIKAEIFPYDSVDINGLLTVIERSKCVQTYAVDSKEYLQVLNFHKHQRPYHTEAASKLPKMTEENIIMANSPLLDSEYPPDTLINRFTDSLIQKPTTRAREQLAIAVEEHQEELANLFPNINLQVAIAKMLHHFRDGHILPDPYMTAMQWFQREFKTGGSNGSGNSGRRHSGSVLPECDGGKSDYSSGAFDYGETWHGLPPVASG